jgi:hypothetical protein
MEASHYHEYLDLRGLLAASLAATLGGWVLLLGAGKSWWYGSTLASWERGQRAFLLGLVALLVMPPLLSLTNRWGTAAQAVATTVIFEQETARYQSRFGSAELGSNSRKPSQYLLFFYWEDQLYRIAYEEGPKFAHYDRGASVTLPISSGRWGFPWIPTEKL